MTTSLQSVKTVEKARGCGYRRPGADGVGIYLVGPSTAVTCGRMPFLLTCCSTCGGGIKPARSWTWINPRALFEVDAPTISRCSLHRTLCVACPIGDAAPERAGLLWIGERFYDSPHAFLRESHMMGVSRKLSAIPRGFKLGETLVYLAHRHAVVTSDDDIRPGIFSCFRPTGIDLVVDDLSRLPSKVETLASMAATGWYGEGADKRIRIVQVERDIDTQGALFNDPQGVSFDDEQEHSNE